MSEPRIVALIPARAGSKRVPGKNTRELNGHPLLAYAIGVAQEAGIFDCVAVSSDDFGTKPLAKGYGAQWISRPEHMAADDSPDVEWVYHAIDSFGGTRLGPKPTVFAIIRPTSPFRRGLWIKRAWELLQESPHADSIRAVRPCQEHPAKMWTSTNGRLAPVMPGVGYHAPYHSMPTQLLPPVFTQTSALEIAWTRVLPGSISGQMVLGYLTPLDAPEAIDINEEGDWTRAEVLAELNPDWLPPVTRT